MTKNQRGYNTNAIYIENENPNSNAYYMIIEDFKTNKPFEVLFCSDLKIIEYEYNQKILKNQHTSYKIELLYNNETGEKTLINNFEEILY